MRRCQVFAIFLSGDKIIKNMALDGLRIAVGSYDGWLYGWESNDSETSTSSSSSSSSSNNKNPDLLDIAYAYEPHVGCVKSAALMTSAGGDWLATGGSDETIRVYNLRKRRDMGALHSHAGAVTCLEFFGKQHLLSGSDDGTLRIWRVSDWACLHVLGGHKSGVTSVAIHPTGRLALSTSSDKTVRLWNLMEGRNAYISKLSSLPTPEKVQFSLDGNHYALLFRNQVIVYSVANGEIVANLENQHVRYSDFCYVSPEHIVISGDDGKLRLWTSEINETESEGTMLHEYDGGMGKERIRAVERLADDRVVILYSNGLVQVWEYNVKKSTLQKQVSLTRVAKTGSRATCLASCTSEGANTTVVSRIVASTGTGGDDASHGGILNKEKEKIKRRKAARKAGGADGKEGGIRENKGKMLNDFLALKKMPRKERKAQLKRDKRKKIDGKDQDKQDAKKRQRVAQHQPWKLKELKEEQARAKDGTTTLERDNKKGRKDRRIEKNGGDNGKKKAQPFKQKTKLKVSRGPTKKKNRRHKGTQ